MQRLNTLYKGEGGGGQAGKQRKPQRRGGGGRPRGGARGSGGVNYQHVEPTQAAQKMITKSACVCGFLAKKTKDQ